MAKQVKAEIVVTRENGRFYVTHKGTREEVQQVTESGASWSSQDASLFLFSAHFVVAITATEKNLDDFCVNNAIKATNKEVNLLFQTHQFFQVDG